MLLIRDIPLVNSEINPGMAVGNPRNQTGKRLGSDQIRVMKRMTWDIKKSVKWLEMAASTHYGSPLFPMKLRSDPHHTTPRFIPMIKPGNGSAVTRPPAIQGHFYGHFSDKTRDMTCESGPGKTVVIPELIPESTQENIGLVPGIIPGSYPNVLPE